MRKDSELTVITRAKELSLYILAVTDKSPKKFRFTLVSRLQNYALEILEDLFLANEIPLDGKRAGDTERRRGYQREAMAELRLLGYIAMIARESICILPKQYVVIEQKIVETQRLLYAWVRSDNKRLMS